MQLNVKQKNVQHIEIKNLKAEELKNLLIYFNNSRASRSYRWFRINLDPDNKIISPSHYMQPDIIKNKKAKILRKEMQHVEKIFE